MIETIKLSPMPLWEHLSPERYQARIRNMIDGIAEKALLQRGPWHLLLRGLEPLHSQGERQRRQLGNERV